MWTAELTGGKGDVAAVAGLLTRLFHQITVQTDDASGATGGGPALDRPPVAGRYEEPAAAAVASDQGVAVAAEGEGAWQEALQQRLAAHEQPTGRLSYALAAAPQDVACLFASTVQLRSPARAPPLSVPPRPSGGGASPSSPGARERWSSRAGASWLGSPLAAQHSERN